MPEFLVEKGLVLSAKPLNEKSYILSLFTKEKGRHLGVLNKKAPPGTGTYFTGRWKARLPEQLGSYYLDDIKSSMLVYLDDISRLSIIACVCSLLETLLPERQKIDEFYDYTTHFLNNLECANYKEKYVLWEVELLSILGFGLDFSACAGGGDKNNLAYVSPKSGRAVSLEKGFPYKEKLLVLPKFLWKTETATNNELKEGLALTSYFLLTHAGLKELPRLRNTIIR